MRRVRKHVCVVRGRAPSGHLTNHWRLPLPASPGPDRTKEQHEESVKPSLVQLSFDVEEIILQLLRKQLATCTLH